MTTPLLEARHLHKHFPGVHALNDISAEFRAGEVLAVMGENGAGKSTLMKTLAGIHPPDAGQILWKGKEVHIPHVRAATALGIAFIHQELNLAENLTVAANVFLGREPRTAGFFRPQEMRTRTQALLTSLGVTFTPDTPVGDLSIGHQQMVEIAKALSQNAQLLIMDEPTSSLSHSETHHLFTLVRQLRAQGLCIVFISHRMAEVADLADRVIVLRDGTFSGELQKQDITRDRIVSLMVGRDLHIPDKATHNTPGAPRLTVTGLRIPRLPQHEINFTLHAGEIVGLAGLVGAGRTDIARALFGIDPALTGTLIIDGQNVLITDPPSAIRAGLALVPEDRKAQGIHTDLPIRDNIALAGLDKFHTLGFLHDDEITATANKMRTRLSIRTTDVFKPVGQLSGGNQQKVAIAKWLVNQPRVFLLDEPTRGVDVGAKSEIYAVIEQMAATGAAILFISSELEEILRISDRVLVMHEGQITGQLTRPHLTEANIMRLATGT